MKRKSLHINLTTSTHTAFKMIAAKYQLSMQELFEEFAVQVVEGNEDFLQIVQKLQERKQDKAGMKFAKTDKESIFEEIQCQNPMN